jgi:hypothetical protein
MAKRINPYPCQESNPSHLVSIVTELLSIFIVPTKSVHVIKLNFPVAFALNQIRRNTGEVGFNVDVGKGR